MRSREVAQVLARATKVAETQERCLIGWLLRGSEMFWTSQTKQDSEQLCQYDRCSINWKMFTHADHILYLFPNLTGQNGWLLGKFTPFVNLHPSVHSFLQNRINYWPGIAIRKPWIFSSALRHATRRSSLIRRHCRQSHKDVDLFFWIHPLSYEGGLYA